MSSAPSQKIRDARITTTPVRFESSSHRSAGWLTNVSARGAFVRTRRFPNVGEDVRLWWGRGQAAVTLRGRARWRGQRADAVHGFRVDLHDPPQSYLELVQTLAGTHSHGIGLQLVAPRVAAVIPVAIEIEALCDSGIIRDISLTGAQLSDTRIETRIGDTLSLTLVEKGKLNGFEVSAVVVRRTECESYAVRFEGIDARSIGQLSKLIESYTRKS